MEALKKAGEEISRWFASLEQYKQEIKAAGFPISNGGYIMDISALLDEAKVENVRAMFDFTREYGVY